MQPKKPVSPAPIRLRPRILLIEDNHERIELFRQWIVEPFVLIEATTGGQALGVIRFGAEGVAGICLDHDLNTNPKTPSDAWVSGSDVVTAICNNKVSRTVPILVHSMNTTKGYEMSKRLKGAGFSVTRIRMAALSRESFLDWLVEVRDTLDFE